MKIHLLNSMFVEYFRANQFGEVLRLYLALRQKNIGIHKLAITFGLKSCIELGTCGFGRSIHADAFKYGFGNDQYVGSSLIGFYCKWNHTREADKAFDEITERDVIAYSSVIAGYAQVGYHSAVKAFTVARDMQRNGFEPNRVTLVSLLKCSSLVRALEEGKMIHGYAIRKKVGFFNEVFETSLMNMYLKCDDPERAAVIFDRMNERSFGSWNALITAHLRLGQPLEAFDLFLQMAREICELDLIALANGLFICADVGRFLVGKSIHCRIVRKGVHLDLVGTTALVDMYSKCGHITGAINVFIRTTEKDCILFNVMIASFLHNGYAFFAMETFNEMVAKCIRPNASTIISVLSALSTMTDKQKAKCLHGYIFRQDLQDDTEVQNQFINTYARWGFVDSARKVFDRIKIKDRVSWTSIMTGHANHGLAKEAVALFRLMQRENVHPDSVTFTSLLQAFNQLGSLISAREVHGHLYRAFLEIDALLKNSLITTYSKWGKLKMSTDLFVNMDKQHLSSWNAIIAAHGMHGDGVRALELFYQMKRAKVSPDGITLKSVLSACSHSGLTEKGLNIFNSMLEEYGIVPLEEHYGCIIDLLGRTGQIEKAYDLLKCVPSAQKTSILGALLGACRVHGNSEMGERVGKWILDVDPHNTSAYCSVSNMYAESKKWEEVARLGAIAGRRGLKRIPGYTLITFS